MPYRIDLGSRTEHALRVGNGVGDNQQCVADFLLAGSIPVRDVEAAGTIRLLDLDGILQAVGLFNVLAIVRIDQYADAYQHVSRSDLFFCVSVGSSAVDHLRHILILIDYLHRHETLACLGQRDRHRSSVEIKHGAAPRRTPSRQAAGGACDRLETPAR